MVQELPKVSTYRRYLAYGYRRRGLARGDLRDPAGAAADVRRAMALIRKAIEMGFRAVNAYRNEDALDPLRSRDDFRLLMMDLEFPSDSFAPDTAAHR